MSDYLPQLIIEYTLLGVRDEFNILKIDYNLLAHPRKLPAKLSIYDALILSKEMREVLVKTLLDLELYLAQLASTE